jgi:hypothetical protein
MMDPRQYWPQQSKYIVHMLDPLYQK